MLRHQIAPAGTPRQAEPLSQYRRHPCLAALPFQFSQAFPLSRLITAPQTILWNTGGKPHWLHAGLEHAPPSTGAHTEGRKKAHAQLKGWPEQVKVQSCTCQQRERTKRGKENELKRESPERGNAYREAKTEHPHAGRRDIKTRKR